MLPDPPRGKGPYGPFSGHSCLFNLQWPLISNVIETPAQTTDIWAIQLHSLYAVFYMCTCILACFGQLADHWLKRLVVLSTLSVLECDDILIRNYNMASKVGCSLGVHYYICDFQRKIDHQVGAQPRLSLTPTTTKMAELTGLPIPHVDWSSSDAPQALRKFKNLCQLYFFGPLNENKKQGRTDKFPTDLVMKGEN